MSDYPTLPVPPQEAPRDASAPQQQGSGPQSDAARTGSRALSVTIAVLGGLALVASGLGVGFGTVWSNSSPGDMRSDSVQAAGAIRVIDIDLSAGGLVVEYGDVDAAVLDYSGNRGPWSLERTSDGVLEVRAPRGDFAWWQWRGEASRATLTLPASAEGADLAVELSAGQFEVDGGSYGDVDIDMNAGWFDFDAAAASLDVDMSAGGGMIEAENVRSASFTLAAGSLDALLTGNAPRTVDVTVTAGSLDLGLPDVPYDVRSNRTAGSLDVDLDGSRGARSEVDVQVNAGDVYLYAD